MLEIVWYKEAEKVYFRTLEFWVKHYGSNEYSLKIILNVEKAEKLISANPLLGRLNKYKNVRII